MRNRNAMGTKFFITDINQEPTSLPKIQVQDLAMLVEHRKMNLSECSGFRTDFYQLAEDYEKDQMSLKEFTDPFTGERVK